MQILILVFVVGILLGLLFYGGLWWTVRKGIVSVNPAVWFLGSFILRAGIVLLGFYFIAASHQWEQLLICLLGFLASRWIVTKWTETSKELQE